jgi:xylulose-5-phosphate/fructose-6-phosphate phosphoketolase
MRRLFRQFSFPGGIPSHAAPETPGSIHEGGELGYALFHAYGAVFDNPELIACCVVGDGEAETGPLATSWHSNKFLNPRTDGAVLPILHLNGYKIANPTVLARISHAELECLLSATATQPIFVEGDDPETMHQLMAAAVDQAIDEIPCHPAPARGGATKRPRWPMIVLRSPERLDRAEKQVDGKKSEGYWRSHQVPFSDMDKPEHVQSAGRLDAFLPAGRTVRCRRPADAELAELAPPATPHGRQSACQRRRAAARPAPAGFSRLRRGGAARRARSVAESTRVMGPSCAM